jgi:hypothetical protein
MVALEGVMETPEEVAVIRQLLERGWSRRRIATELEQRTVEWCNSGGAAPA